MTVCNDNWQLLISSRRWRTPGQLTTISNVEEDNSKLSNVVLSRWWRSRGQLTMMSSLIWFWTSMKPSDTDTPPVVGDVWQHELRVLPPQPHQITTHSHLASFFFSSSSTSTFYPSCPSPPPRLPASLKPAVAPPPPFSTICYLFKTSHPPSLH